MAIIATNVFNDLTKTDKDKVIGDANKLGKIEFFGYAEKALELDDVVKFILQGFDLRNFLRDAVLWDLFKDLISRLIELSKTKKRSWRSIQFWIKDETREPSFNISFSVLEGKNIPDLLISLKQTLEKELDKNLLKIKKGSVIWISYDIEQKKWNIKIL